MAKRKSKVVKNQKTVKPTVVKTKKAVADHFEVSVRTVTDWMNRLDPMPGGDGKFDLIAIKEWRSRTFAKGKDQQVIDPGASPESEQKSLFKDLQHELQKVKLRKESALAQQNEIKATKMDDEFVPMSLVNEWVGEFLSLQRKLLSAVPVEMFAAAPDDIKEVYQPDLKARIDIHLNQMADWVERVEDLRGRKRS